MTNEGALSVNWNELNDAEFAKEWQFRYQYRKAAMFPDITRWLILTRYFHPRRMEDHWRDSLGRPSKKLVESDGLSIEIYNMCRSIIEVYQSLLAGAKPWPFGINIPPTDALIQSERFRADAAEKILLQDFEDQAIPLHFMDFCTSVVLYGIGYVLSWVDKDSRRIQTQTIPWPGDVLPQWGSDRYVRQGKGMENCIIVERVGTETAERIYGRKFIGSAVTDTMRPNTDVVELSAGRMGVTPDTAVQILKTWYRWNDDKGKEHIGYAEVLNGERQEAETLYRENDTKYPDVPVRWTARVQTPGEPPHRAAGVLDDVVGPQTEYNEKLCALADLLTKRVYLKYKGRGFSEGNPPLLLEGQNMYLLGAGQDITPIIEEINNFPFDSFLNRLETNILMSAGLSRLLMGSMPPGETSGEALNNLMHAAISRLEVVRTPIQWTWTSLFYDLWYPFYIKFGSFTVTDAGKPRVVRLRSFFENTARPKFRWPDVTPRDSLRSIQTHMALGQADYLSRESVMERADVASVVDELEQIRREKQDVVMRPNDVRETALARQAEMQTQMPSVQLKGQLTPEEVSAALSSGSIAKQGAATADSRRKTLAKKAAPQFENNNERPPVQPGSQQAGAFGNLNK